MLIPQYDTCRCHLFENISESTWQRILNAHSVSQNLNEPGITADIISAILQYTKRSYPNFDVYARKGWNEQEYGSDLDVFVETRKGEYKWFALQAKLLKENGRYTTLRDTSDGIMQWEKLLLLEGLTGCTSYYLLYNGVENWNYDDIDQCRNPFDEKQFGCSLVAPGVIERLASTPGKNGRYVNPRFEDIHPDDAEPWRVLTCCRQSINGDTLYTRGQILDADWNFRRIVEPEDMYQFSDEGLDSNIPESQRRRMSVNDIENEITIASNKANWNPTLKILVNRTS